MITAEEIRNALRKVMDPELGRNIVDLGMVRDAFLGQVPLDPELARRCDSGEIESYPVDVFAPIVTLVSELVPDVKCKPQI